MAEIYVAGKLTDRMRAYLEPHVTIAGHGAVEDAPSHVDGLLVMNFGQVDRAALERFDDLKIVSNFGVGYDNVDADAAAERGIVVSHTPDVLNEEVATTTVLLILACYRRLLRDDAYVRSGRWEKEGPAPLTRTADGRTVGILGLGRIGHAIARKMEAFDATIVYHSRSRKDVPYQFYDDLVEMARDVDVLVVITPGGPETRHLVDRKVMDALGPDGCLINIARGTVVDESALIAALQEGRLGMAGLDVFEQEPHVPLALRQLENVVLLPHMGSATVETRRAMADLTMDNIITYFTEGRAKTAVPETAHL